MEVEVGTVRTNRDLSKELTEKVGDTLNRGAVGNKGEEKCTVSGDVCGVEPTALSSQRCNRFISVVRDNPGGVWAE